MTAIQWDRSIVSDIEDPEDALQKACAEENACQVIISQDRHFINSQSGYFRVLSPEEFVKEITI